MRSVCKSLQTATEASLERGTGCHLEEALTAGCISGCVPEIRITYTALYGLDFDLIIIATY